SQLDAVADSFRWGSSLLLGAGGALLGSGTTMAEGIAGAQLVIPSLILTDVTSSMTLLSRHTCRIATTYGYSSRNPENLPHLVAAMAPHADSSDEGYLALKTAVVTSIRESGQFMARTAGMVMDRQLLEREAPQMIRLITYVADRLGIVINGIFVMAEMALVSSRKPRLQQLANEGDGGAQIAVDLSANPDRFLATTQIGITLIAILAGAFGERTLTERLSIQMERLRWLASYREGLAFAIAAVAIT